MEIENDWVRKVVIDQAAPERWLMADGYDATMQIVQRFSHWIFVVNPSPSINLSICLSMYLSICLSIYLSFYFFFLFASLDFPHCPSLSMSDREMRI